MTDIQRLWRARINNAPLDIAGWVAAPVVLALLSVSVQIVAQNPFFLTAHGTNAATFGLAVAGGIVIATAVLWLTFSILRRLTPAPVFDAIATGMVFIAMVLALTVLVTQVLANVVVAGLAWLIGILIAIAGAAGVALLSRRAKAGKAVIVIASAVSLFPLASLAVGGISEETSSTNSATIEFDDSAERPPILLLVADELSYPVVSDRDGVVRPLLPNLQDFQQTSTTFTNAYATANATHFAIPTMLAGMSDASRQGEYPPEVTGSGGPLSWLQSRYRVATDSIYFRANDDGAPFVDLAAGSTIDEQAPSPSQRWRMLGLDFIALVGRSALPEPVTELFPPLDDRWYDFWDVEPEPEYLAVGGDFIEVLTDADNPGLVFWHSMLTHTPYVRDYVGTFWTPNSLGLREGGLGTESVVELQRQVYAAAAVAFDGQVGWIMNELRRAGTFDETMIIITSDHGRAFPLESTWRVGDDRDQRWADVAHIPLFVKMPGQTEPDVESGLRTTAQISRTMLDAAGATVTLDTGPALAPSLEDEALHLPIFWFDKRTGEAGVEEYEPFSVPESWDTSYFQARHSESPFAVGIDRGLIGREVPGAWEPVVTFPGAPDEGSSTQRAIEVSVPPGSCPAAGGFGIVAQDGVIVGSVAWGPEQDGSVTGWGVVPEAGEGDYLIFCEAAL